MEYSDWRKYTMIQSRFDMRWMYRWCGYKVPRLPWEVDYAQVDAIEKTMDTENESHRYN